MHTTPKLDAGDAFPSMSLATPDGAGVTLPDHFAGGWGVILIYRGHW